MLHLMSYAWVALPAHIAYWVSDVLEPILLIFSSKVIVKRKIVSKKLNGEKPSIRNGKRAEHQFTSNFQRYLILSSLIQQVKVFYAFIDVSRTILMCFMFAIFSIFPIIIQEVSNLLKVFNIFFFQKTFQAHFKVNCC